MDQRAEVRSLVQTLLQQKGDAGAFSDNSSLLLSGRLSSIEAVEIVIMLEQNFGIDFSEIGFDQTMIDSVDSICSLISTEKSV